MECWLPRISTIRTQRGSNYLDAAARKAGPMRTNMVVEWARLAPESSNTVSFTLDEFQRSGKILAKLALYHVPVYQLSSVLCLVVLCLVVFFFFSFFQALYIKPGSPCLFLSKDKWIQGKSFWINCRYWQGFVRERRLDWGSMLLLGRIQKERSRTAPVHEKLQMKPGNCEKSITTMKNTNQPMSSPYEIIVLRKGSTMGFGKDDSFWSELHQSTGRNNLASKLPGLYFPAFLGPEQQNTSCLLDS